MIKKEFSKQITVNNQNNQDYTPICCSQESPILCKQIKEQIKQLDSNDGIIELCDKNQDYFRDKLNNIMEQIDKLEWNQNERENQEINSSINKLNNLLELKDFNTSLQVENTQITDNTYNNIIIDNNLFETPQQNDLNNQIQTVDTQYNNKKEEVQNQIQNSEKQIQQQKQLILKMEKINLDNQILISRYQKEALESEKKRENIESLVRKQQDTISKLNKDKKDLNLKIDQKNSQINKLKNKIQQLEEQMNELGQEHRLLKIDKEIFMKTSDKQSKIIRTYKLEELCLICMDKKRSHISFPCGHFIYCEDCINKIIQQQNENLCSYCRVPIQQSVKVIINVLDI